MKHKKKSIFQNYRGEISAFNSYNFFLFYFYFIYSILLCILLELFSKCPHKGACTSSQCPLLTSFHCSCDCEPNNSSFSLGPYAKCCKMPFLLSLFILLPASSEVLNAFTVSVIP